VINKKFERKWHVCRKAKLCISLQYMTFTLSIFVSVHFNNIYAVRKKAIKILLFFIIEGKHLSVIRFQSKITNGYIVYVNISYIIEKIIYILIYKFLIKNKSNLNMLSKDDLQVEKNFKNILKFSIKNYI